MDNLYIYILYIFNEIWKILTYGLLSVKVFWIKSIIDNSI